VSAKMAYFFSQSLCIVPNNNTNQDSDTEFF